MRKSDCYLCLSNEMSFCPGRGVGSSQVFQELELDFKILPMKSQSKYGVELSSLIAVLFPGMQMTAGAYNKCL